MDVARYRAFITAVETGSLTAAAERMHYSPSGVSQLITALERELGIELLHRTKKGTVLTPGGERVLPLAQRLVREEQSIFDLAAEINALSVGEVRIATFSSISTHWLPNVIRRFQAEYPGITIKLMEGIRREIVSWLDGFTADVGFLSYLDDMTYDWIPLAEDKLFAVLPRSHPLASEKVYPLKECAKEHFIMPALGHDEDIALVLQENHIVPDIRFTTLENYAAMAMIECGLGMSIMNELITLNWECDVVKLPLDPPQHITLGMALPSLSRASPAVKKFVACAVQELSGKGNGRQDARYAGERK